MKDSRAGLEHMAKIGVMEIGPSNNSKEWIGINMQAAQHFTWSAMLQTHKRLEAVEEALEIVRGQVSSPGITPEV
jgi:hypothetical protein